MAAAATKLYLAGLLAVLLSGCVSAHHVQVAEIEAGADQMTPAPNRIAPSFDENIAYAEGLANTYLKLSDKAASAQDAVAIGFIADAALAAGGLLYNSNISLIKAAGLAAGTMTATTGYFKPAETSAALLDASEQLLCVRNAAALVPTGARSDPDVEDIFTSSILTVRLNLRKKLERKLPDYQSLVNSLKTAYTNISRVHTESVAYDINTFRAAAATCLLK